MQYTPRGQVNSRQQLQQHLIPSYKNWSNHVLHQETERMDKMIIYLPCFVTVDMDNIISIDFVNLCGSIKYIVSLRVYFGEIKKQFFDIYDQLTKQIEISFNRNEPITLNTKDQQLVKKINLKWEEERGNILKFTFQKQITCEFQSGIFFSPLETINFNTCIEIRQISTKSHINKQYITIRFNCMELQKKKDMFGYNYDEITYGNYELATQKMNIWISDDKQKKNQQIELKKKKTVAKEQINKRRIQPSDVVKKKIRITDPYFNYIHLSLTFNKHPYVALATIFIPLMLLGVINLGIFFQSNSLDSRIASIATVMIAFMALLPTIRGQLPSNPTITFVQILVYLEGLTSILCLFDSLIINSDLFFVFDWRTNDLFITSMSITIFNAFVVIVMIVIHQFVHKEAQKHRQCTKKKFQRSQWQNKNFEQKFRHSDNINNPLTQEEEKILQINLLQKWRDSYQQLWVTKKNTKEYSKLYDKEKIGRIFVNNAIKSIQIQFHDMGYIPLTKGGHKFEAQPIDFRFCVRETQTGVIIYDQIITENPKQITIQMDGKLSFRY